MLIMYDYTSFLSEPFVKVRYNLNDISNIHRLLGNNKNKYSDSAHTRSS